MANVDILRTNIYWSKEASGFVSFANYRWWWTDHQCCCNGNSKPSCSTMILRLISIQHSIRCTKDQCHQGEFRYTHNKHILIKGGIRLCRWRLLHVSFLIYYHRMYYYAVMIVRTSAGMPQNSKLLFYTKLHPSPKLLSVLLVKSDIRKYFWSVLTGGVLKTCEILRKKQVS